MVERKRAAYTPQVRPSKMTVGATIESNICMRWSSVLLQPNEDSESYLGDITANMNFTTTCHR